MPEMMRAYSGNSSSGRLALHDGLRFAIALMVVLGVTLVCGDRIGFEGDDLAVISGATHFDFRPLESLYRLPWQPLSYLLLRAFLAAGTLPLALTYLSSVLGGLGLVLLAETVRSLLTTPYRTWLAYALVLSVPELLVTVLYFNTTALGLPFFAGALLLLCLEARPDGRWAARLATAAVLYAVACCMRLDFAVAALPMLLLVYRGAAVAKFPRVAAFAGISAAAGVLILLALGISPVEALRGAGALEGEPWPAWRSAMVLALSILPLIGIAPFLWLEIRRRRWPRLPGAMWVLIAVSAAVLYYPLRTLYSGKYLVPAFSVSLVALALLLRQPLASPAQPQTGGSAFKPMHLYCCGIVLLAVYTLGIQVDRAAKHLSITTLPSTFTTDDGVRPLGAYLRLLGIIKRGELRPAYISLYRNIAAWISGSEADATVILVDDYQGPDKEWSAPLVNNWTWGWPALYLQSSGWTLEAYEFKRRIGLHRNDGRKALILVGSSTAATLGAPTGCSLRLVARDIFDWKDYEQYAAAVARSPCESSPIDIRGHSGAAR